MIELEKIKQLIDLVTQNRIAALDMTKGDMRIRIEAVPNVASTACTPTSAVAVELPERPTTPETAAGSNAAPEPNVIRAPTDGVIHLAPSPGAAPFVSTGQVVQPDETVCVIEVMKMFYPVPATVGGTIQAVQVKDGQHIGFDEVLFVLS